MMKNLRMGQRLRTSRAAAAVPSTTDRAAELVEPCARPFHPAGSIPTPSRSERLMTQPRLLALIAFVIAFALTACGASSNGASSSDEPATVDNPSESKPESTPSGGSLTSSPSESDSSATPTQGDETVAVPRTLDASGFCADIDRSSVEKVLGSKIVQEAKTEPGDALGTTEQKAMGYTCSFTSSTDFNEPRLNVSWSKVAVDLSDVRKSRAPNVAKNGCEFADLPGLAPEGGFVYTCPEIATAGRSQFAEILVAIAVGKTVFNCNLFAHQPKLPVSPSATATFCIDQLGKMAS